MVFKIYIYIKVITQKLTNISVIEQLERGITSDTIHEGYCTLAK